MSALPEATREVEMKLVRKAPPIKINEEQTIADVFATILLSCIRHFRLNEALIVADRNVEALHQGRVAMRRLRAALSLFRPVIRRSTFRELRHDLRWFTAALGEARNLDVFAQAYGSSLAPADLKRLREARERAYDVAIEHIKSQRSRDLFTGILGWLETAPWQRRQANSSIRPFATQRLQQLWEQVDSAAAHIDTLSDDDLHLLRIDIKKMRSGVAFRGALYDRERVKAWSKALEALQDGLGEWNDEVLARELAQTFSVTLPNKPAAVGRKKQLVPIRKLLAGLKRRRPFWATDG